MSIIKTPFRKRHLEDNKQDVVSIKLNEDDRALFDKVKYLLQQEKDSTALKQCYEIALKVILDEKTITILSHVLNNYRRNKRLGIVTYDDVNYENFIKSKLNS